MLIIKGIYIRFSEINVHIIKNYKVEDGALDTACINTVIIVKFKIAAGLINSVEFTKSVPLPIKRALEKAFRLHNGGVL